MSQDEFTSGLQYGFEAADRPRELPLVYRVDDWRVRVRPSCGQPIVRGWQAPHQRIAIAKDIFRLHAEGFIRKNEADELLDNVWQYVLNHIDLTTSIDEDEPFALWLANQIKFASDDDGEPAPFMEWWFFALGLGSILCGGVFAWLVLEIWR